MKVDASVPETVTHRDNVGLLAVTETESADETLLENVPNLLFVLNFSLAPSHFTCPFLEI
jgi:hypothetical protein